MQLKKASRPGNDEKTLKAIKKYCTKNHYDFNEENFSTLLKNDHPLEIKSENICKYPKGEKFSLIGNFFLIFISFTKLAFFMLYLDDGLNGLLWDSYRFSTTKCSCR